LSRIELSDKKSPLTLYEENIISFFGLMSDENINAFDFQSPPSKNKDDCKPKLEIKKGALDEIEVQRGLEIMDKLDGQNQAQDDFDSKIEVKKEMKKKGELQKVEKLDVGESDSEFSETEIKDDCKTKLEIKKEAANEIEVQRGIEIMDKLKPPKGSFFRKY
jgi:hypothetical protein